MSLKSRFDALRVPAPAPTPTMLVGVSQGLFSQFAQKVGAKKIPIRRSYGGMVDSCVTLANEDKAAGRTAWVSLNTWPGDAAIDAFIKRFTGPTMLTYLHEVDLISKEITDAAEFVRRHQFLYDAAKRLNPLVKVGPIFTANPFRTGSASNGTSIQSWVPQRMHFLGIDAYHYQRDPAAPVDPKIGTHGNPRNMAFLLGEQTAAGVPRTGGAVSTAKARGVPIAIGEYGFHPWPTDPAYRPRWLRETHAYLNSVGCYAEMYFHSPRGMSGPWLIDQFHVYTADENDPARMTGKPDPDSLAAFTSFLP